MNKTTHHYSLLSSCFAHGAYQTQNFNRPELRAPSIKGMIRWWHKALGYPEQDALAIFGSVANKKLGTINQASQVSFRVQSSDELATQKTYFMPHKGGRGGEKFAIQPGSEYALTIIERRAGLSDTHREQLERVAKAWLLLGSIGQRSNRAAGSIFWDGCPKDQKNFVIEASALLKGSKVSFALLNTHFEDELEAREIAGDFLEDKAFGGTAPFGSAYPRKPSPLMLKCVWLDDALRLLAIWDYRKESPNNLSNGVAKLVSANKKIGLLLEDALPRLTASS